MFDAVVKANIQIARVIRHIRALGLKIAENKTEAVLFTRNKFTTLPRITVGRSKIQVSRSMKYLGVIIDTKWNFIPHFDYIKDKITKATRALSRLMPNLRGPGEKKRRLYANVLTSIAMYAAPVWGRALAGAPRKYQRGLHNLQRVIAIRVTASYRTVSFDASTLLARMPPWTLEATLRCRIYERTRELIRSGVYGPGAVSEIRNGETNIMFRQWTMYLQRQDVWGRRTVDAIIPHLTPWCNRKFGELNYYCTQILTGHGYFGHFLFRIGKSENTNCFHCTDSDDTAEHTLAICPAWDIQRAELHRQLDIGNEDLTLGNIVGRILEGHGYWIAFSNYITTILKVKEEEERRREKITSSSPL